MSRSDVKERVVWVDTKKTQVKNKTGKLKEKETTILEVFDPLLGKGMKIRRKAEKQSHDGVFLCCFRCE